MSIGLGIAIAALVTGGVALILSGERFIGGSMLGSAVVLAITRSA